jgi:hydroxymethylpyrimidine kinase/phosphomethylpyrimidine kinase
MTIQTPIALTIAGSDSGGGAGLQADLKTFAARGVFGTCAITCVTAQSPGRITEWQPLDVRLVRRQIETVLADLPVIAAKTGMLGSEAIVKTVSDIMARNRTIQWVVDPVLIASSGRNLMTAAAARRMQSTLIPLATVVTPNLPEAEYLSGRPIRGLDDMLEVAQLLSTRWGVACLLKGGHLVDTKKVTDVLWQGKQHKTMSSPRIGTLDLHGTGCTLSAGITAQLAKGQVLLTAIKAAQGYIRQAIKSPVAIGRFHALGWG